MEDANNSIQLHSIIDNALFVVDMCEYQVGIYEQFLESEEEEKKKWELSEDESMWNQNVIGIRQRVDEESISYSRPPRANRPISYFSGKRKSSIRSTG